MHPVIIICVILAILITVLAIILGIKKHNELVFAMIFLIGTITIVGGLGFGLICSVVTWNKTHQKISPDKVETNIFKNNGIVASAYDGRLYQSKDIKDLNAVNNIDYYILVIKYNAYNVETCRLLYPIEKGKINDCIKEKE